MRIAGVVAVAASALLVLSACAPIGSPERPVMRSEDRPDPDTAAFDPGFIISDDSFFDSGALSEAQIQEFLESRTCIPRDPVPCLDEYRETTVTQPAVGGLHCAEYTGGLRERASRIIAKAAEACGVSPKALLVLLQKEQSLLTRPSTYGYERATGYACPDTADCAAEYLGFFNQVYNAAWQFRQYTEEPDRQYRIGPVDVGYHPDVACGAAAVDIRNQATANLYNYTPYQPNDATLAGPRAGDACSTFGNLNFWRIWHRWFGDPTDERFPRFLPECARLVGGHPCPEPVVTIPAVPELPSA